MADTTDQPSGIDFPSKPFAGHWLTQAARHHGLAAAFKSDARWAVLEDILDRVSPHSPMPWPAVSEIARRTGLNQRTVRRALKDLMKCGAVKYDPNNNGYDAVNAQLGLTQMATRTPHQFLVADMRQQQIVAAIIRAEQADTTVENPPITLAALKDAQNHGGHNAMGQNMTHLERGSFVDPGFNARGMGGIMPGDGGFNARGMGGLMPPKYISNKTQGNRQAEETKATPVGSDAGGLKFDPGAATPCPSQTTFQDGEAKTPCPSETPPAQPINGGNDQHRTASPSKGAVQSPPLSTVTKIAGSDPSAMPAAKPTIIPPSPSPAPATREERPATLPKPLPLPQAHPPQPPPQTTAAAKHSEHKPVEIPAKVERGWDWENKRPRYDGSRVPPGPASPTPHPSEDADGDASTDFQLDADGSYVDDHGRPVQTATDFTDLRE